MNRYSKEGHNTEISSVLVISMVIDSDRGHCYNDLKKKNQFMMKIEHVTCI